MKPWFTSKCHRSQLVLLVLAPKKKNSHTDHLHQVFSCNLEEFRTKGREYTVWNCHPQERLKRQWNSWFPTIGNCWARATMRYQWSISIWNCTCLVVRNHMLVGWDPHVWYSPCWLQNRRSLHTAYVFCCYFRSRNPTVFETGRAPWASLMCRRSSHLAESGKNSGSCSGSKIGGFSEDIDMYYFCFCLGMFWPIDGCSLKKRKRKVDIDIDIGHYTAIAIDMTTCVARWTIIHTPENDVLWEIPVLPIMSNVCESWIGTGS